MQAVLQHTPSTQWPSVHCASALHAAPGSCVGAQRPPEHHLPAPHCALVVHEPAPPQAVPTQEPGKHDCSCGSGQRPSPEQNAPRVATLLVQEAERHEVSLSGYLQPSVFLPSQVPLQALPSVVQAVRAPRGSPVTAVQVPSWPFTSQASHCAPQAVLQQKPSTH